MSEKGFDKLPREKLLSVSCGSSVIVTVLNSWCFRSSGLRVEALGLSVTWACKPDSLNCKPSALKNSLNPFLNLEPQGTQC